MGAERHAFGHLEGVGIPQVTVGFGDQIPTVLMADPASNDLEINPGLDGIAAKVMPQAMVHEGRQLGLGTGGDNGAFGIIDGYHPVGRCVYGLAFDAFEQFAHRGEKRDHPHVVVFRAALAASDGKGVTVPIHVTPGQIHGLAQPHAGISEEFDQIPRRFGANIGLPDGFDEPGELGTRWYDDL